MGPGYSRNIGISAARGRYLMFLDSDDTWHANHVQNLIALFETGAEVAYGTALCQDEIRCTTFFIPENGKAPTGWCTDALLGWCHMVPSAFAITRTAFEKTGGFPHMKFGEDWRFFLKLSLFYRFYFCGTVITGRRLHNESICTGSGIQEQAMKLLQAILCDITECSQFTDNPKTLEALHIHLEHVKKEGHQWKTVQDWYTSLKRHGLI